MSYTKITPEILSQLSAIIGSGNILTDHTAIENYSHDETEDLVYYPEVVVKPQTVEQVSALMKFCNEQLIPVTPRGAGTGLAGGALAVNGGLMISMELFNKVLDIDEQNLQATVEPGVITEIL
jgi:glycolate oxidase